MQPLARAIPYEMELWQYASCVKFITPPTGSKKADMTKEAQLAYNEDMLAKHGSESQLWTDASVDTDDDGEPVAGGAALLYTRDVQVKLFRSESSPLSCSFSAEGDIIRKALEEMAADVHDPPIPELSICVDTLSNLELVAVGPLHCRPEGHSIWHSMLKMASRGTKITWIFLYSHCGLARADDVDEEAKKVAGSYPNEPQWWVDTARKATLPLIEEHDKQQCKDTFRYDIQKGAPSRLMREMWNMNALELRMLFQVRTGVCPTLGTWKNEERDPCKLCQETSNRQEACAHLFFCDDPLAKRLREQYEITQKADLWTAPKKTAKWLCALRSAFEVLAH
jgi:hypothetical protein